MADGVDGGARRTSAGPPPRRRDRRGRGVRGPLVLPRRPGRPETGSRRERFDDLALRVVSSVDRPWRHRLGEVEYVVEDAPVLPAAWREPTVPLAWLERGTPTRIVLFRRPIEHRCETHDDLEALVLTVVVEQLAELLGIDPHDVDPRYE